MATINEIRLRIQELYHDNPDIHIDVSMNRPRIHIVNQEATIKGVYKNVFQIKTGGGMPHVAIFWYSDQKNQDSRILIVWFNSRGTSTAVLF